MSDIDVGQIVSIETSDNPPTPNSHYELTANQFANAYAIAVQFLNLLVGTDGLSGVIGEIRDGIVAPHDTSVDYGAVDVDFIPTSAGSAPAFTGTIEEIPSEDIPIPSMVDLPSIDLSTLTAPETPAEISAVLSWTATTPAETILSDILVLLTAWDLGLDPDEEQAIYDRAKLRFQEENAAEYAKLNNDILSRQHQAPSGVLISALGTLAAKIVTQEQDIDNNIITTRADLLRKREEFKVSNMILLEQLIRTAHEGSEGRNLDYAKALAENVRANAKHSLEIYVADMEARKSYVLAQVENLKAIVDQNRGLVDLYKGQNEGYRTKVEAVASKNKAITDVYVAETNGFEAVARAIGVENQTTVSAKGLLLQNATLELQAATANANNTLQKFIAETNAKEKSIADMAGLMVQALASALGSCNASVSLGYSGSESKSEHWSQSKSLSENHGFEHEVT